MLGKTTGEAMGACVDSLFECPHVTSPVWAAAWAPACMSLPCMLSKDDGRNVHKAARQRHRLKTQ